MSPADPAYLSFRLAFAAFVVGVCLACQPATLPKDQFVAKGSGPDATADIAAPVDVAPGDTAGEVAGACKVGLTCKAPAGSCKTSVCLENGTCLIEDAADGLPCDDGDACTEADACKAKVCKGTAKV